MIFHSWLVPGYMSLEDMERVIRAIDARIAEYLGKPLPTQEDNAWDGFAPPRIIFSPRPVVAEALDVVPPPFSV